MCITLERRKFVEISQKLGSLDAEFEHWLELSADEAKPFRIHYTQVRAIVSTLNGLRGAIVARLDTHKNDDITLDAPANLLADARAIQQMILDVHRIWGYFRTKFVQRLEELFGMHLRAADELAWACYHPVRDMCYPDALDNRRREPPLVFFNGGLSPFALSRDRAYAPEDTGGEYITAPPLRRVLKRLPIPLIGVPWFQVQHLPDALVIVHETGHIVEDDFALTPRLQELLREALTTSGASLSRRGAWTAWLGEAFADLYGCLAAGPAFATTLADFLAGPASAVIGEQRTEANWGDYPTATLRVLLCGAVLRETGFGKEAETLEIDWRRSYPTHKMPDFEPDLIPIARSICNGAFPTLKNQTLTSINSLTADHQACARETVDRLKAEMPLDHTDNVRVLFAAVRLSYEDDPIAFYQKSPSYAQRLLARINEVMLPTRRGSEQVLSEEQSEALQASQRAAGAELLPLWLPPDPNGVSPGKS